MHIQTEIANTFSLNRKKIFIIGILIDIGKVSIWLYVGEHKLTFFFLLHEKLLNYELLFL